MQRKLILFVAIGIISQVRCLPSSEAPIDNSTVASTEAISTTALPLVELSTVNTTGLTNFTGENTNEQYTEDPPNSVATHMDMFKNLFKIEWGHFVLNFCQMFASVLLVFALLKIPWVRKHFLEGFWRDVRIRTNLGVNKGIYNEMSVLNNQ